MGFGPRPRRALGEPGNSCPLGTEGPWAAELNPSEKARGALQHGVVSGRLQLEESEGIFPSLGKKSLRGAASRVFRSQRCVNVSTCARGTVNRNCSAAGHLGHPQERLDARKRHLPSAEHSSTCQSRGSGLPLAAELCPASPSCTRIS